MAISTDCIMSLSRWVRLMAPRTGKATPGSDWGAADGAVARVSFILLMDRTTMASGGLYAGPRHAPDVMDVMPRAASARLAPAVRSRLGCHPFIQASTMSLRIRDSFGAAFGRMLLRGVGQVYLLPSARAGAVLPNLERIIAGEHSGLYQVDGVYPMKPFCVMSVFSMTLKYALVTV